eukprot:332131-Prymnesium_polylepis.1
MGISSPFWREHAHEAADTLDAPEPALRACSQSPMAMQGGPKAPARVDTGRTIHKVRVGGWSRIRESGDSSAAE